MRVLDLFSGIGGFSLGLERAGMQTVAFCEIDPFCRRVLAKHWPEVPCYDDVRTLTAERLAADGIAVDVICGGFPCQDLSRAGTRGGLDGQRSGLWSEFRRLIGELRPQYVIVENVPDLLTGGALPGEWFGRLLGDMAELRLDAEWHRIPACAVGLRQLRDRIWIVAYPNGDDDRRAANDSPIRGGTAACESQAGRADRERHRRGSGDGGEAPLARFIASQHREEWRPEPAVGRMVDGVPAGLDRWRKRSVASFGNAVAPYIPELIGRAILAAEASAMLEAA